MGGGCCRSERREDFNTEGAEQPQSSQREEKRKAPVFAGASFVGRRLIVVERYQFSFRANWNWRASKAAVGWPAVQVAAVVSQSWVTAAMLARLNRLKASAMRSRRKRSPKLMPLETRRAN